MNEVKPSFLRRLLGRIWHGVDVFRRVVFNLIFLLLVVGFFSLLFGGDDAYQVPESSALVLKLKGDIVEQKVAIDPWDEAMGEFLGKSDRIPEVLLSDVINVINHAKNDSRINTLVLDLGWLRSGGLNKFDEIGAAIEEFKTTGKPVIAVGDYYTQNQYYLASYADEILMNPMGWVSVEGYGAYGMYYRKALEKFKVTPHVFRVGTYKSAVEPFLRDDMSEEAKEANKAWLTTLWNQYVDAVSQRREIAKAQFDWDLDTFYNKLDASDGDFGQFAIDNQWVDQLLTREQMQSHLVSIVGSNAKGDSYNQVSYDRYLTAISGPKLPTATDKVAIVVAKGTIMNGSQPAGSIGGDSTARLLRKARLDDSVKAVVLRIDSPGGSTFASEVIRQEVEELRAAGKPVVASMSTYAASGGYWIAAPANEIWASPSTVTGSIGIFGMFATFENSLDAIGVHSDGVATNEMANFSPARALPPKMADIIQLNIEKGYDQFLKLVSENRDMSVEQVDNIAQGRVWIGTTALELGLVDKLGSYSDAIAAAAKIAGLDRYDTQIIQREMSPREQLIQEIFGVAEAWLPASPSIPGTNQNGMWQLINKIMFDFKLLNQFNDPSGAYAYCLVCKVS